MFIHTDAILLLLCGCDLRLAASYEHAGSHIYHDRGHRAIWFLEHSANVRHYFVLAIREIH